MTSSNSALAKFVTNKVTYCLVLARLSLSRAAPAMYPASACILCQAPCLVPWCLAFCDERWSRVDQAKCLAPKCGVPLNDKDGETAVCRHHKAEEPQICMHTIIKVNEMQENFSRLWTQCQRCQGSLHQEVLCTAKDCPIFYRRRKAHKDLIETQKQLERFSTSW
jgi:hypothetical protein